jgi:hypothetical protein
MLERLEPEYERFKFDPIHFWELFIERAEVVYKDAG